MITDTAAQADFEPLAGEFGFGRMPYRVWCGGEKRTGMDWLQFPDHGLETQLEKIVGLARKLIPSNQLQMERFYNELFDSIAEPTYSLDLDGGFRGFNKAMLELVGWDRQALSGLNFRTMLEGAEKELGGRKFAAAIRGEKQVYEITGRRKDGTISPVEVVNIPLRIDGRVCGVLGIAKALDERNELNRFKALFTISVDMMCVAGVDGKFKQVNGDSTIRPKLRHINAANLIADAIADGNAAVDHGVVAKRAAPLREN